MRIRTIKPEFWSDEVIGELSPLARLTFIGAWNLADDEGLLKWTPAYIKAQLFPYDAITQEEVGNILGTLQECSLVFPYQDGKAKKYGWIVNFRKHQRIDKPQKAKHPFPSLQNDCVRRMYAHRDNWICGCCGEEINPTEDSKKYTLSIDHITPRSSGGSDAPSNLQAVHFGCNASKRDKDISQKIPGTFQEDSGNVPGMFVECSRRKGKEGNREQGREQGRKKEEEEKKRGPETEPRTKPKSSPRKATRQPVDDPAMIRLGGIFWSRNPELWPAEDIRRYRDAAPTAEEIDLVCRYYLAPIREDSDLRFKRKSLQTMLNNWSVEVGKAEQYAAAPHLHDEPRSLRQGNDHTIF